MTTYNAFLDAKRQLSGRYGFAPTFLPSWLYDFQSELVEWATKKGRAAIFADTGLGKGLPLSTPVLTPSGWREIGRLVEGDMVIGRDGKAHSVTVVHRRGSQPVFRIHFSDGVSIVCDDDHLWNVKSNNDDARGKPWRTMSTRELRGSTIRYGLDGKSRTWRIPMVDSIEFASSSRLPLHPYLLGVLLGDGHFAGTPSWTKNDPEIAERIADVIPLNVAIVPHDRGDRSTSWSLVNDTHVANPVNEAIKSLGLVGLTAADKFVPDRYLFASASDRLALLQGLMDTDGYCGDPTPEFASASRALADAVVFLAQSFGGTGHLSEKPEPTYEYKGESRI